MKNLLSILFFKMLLLGSTVYAQQSIDGTIPFQSDPAKKYSLYIPSSYEEGTENPAFLGLHPLNTRRWNAQSWRDTLRTFAESNGVILICPDGGADGRIDDPIDTAFTTFLLDSVMKAYSIDDEAMYVIGFSWGGRTTYTYGLGRPDKFRGYIPIGAAINGLNEIGGVLNNAKDENIFIIHGSADAPATRFYPARQALLDAGACLRDTLVPGIGHTIDFVGRNALLTQAYVWLSQSPCSTTGYQTPEPGSDWALPNPWPSGHELHVPPGINLLAITDLNGNQFDSLQHITGSGQGVYLVSYITSDSKISTKKLVIF